MPRYISISYSNGEKSDGFSRQSFSEDDRAAAIQFLQGASVQTEDISHTPEVADAAAGESAALTDKGKNDRKSSFDR